MRLLVADLADRPTVLADFGSGSQVILGEASQLPQLLREILDGGHRVRDETSFAKLPSSESVRLLSPVRKGQQVWGVGLNYRAHATDLGAELPTEPVSFWKGPQTFTGPDAQVVLPPQSERITGEAELGVVVGRECWGVSAIEASSCIAAICVVLDYTAEDILMRNPRFLMRAKNFPTFASFGAEFLTFDDLKSHGASLSDLRVSTVLNGVVEREDSVAGMTFDPATLVSFHSHFTRLYPGDVISTGTPGAVAIEDGDVIEARIEGLLSLKNAVKRPTENEYWRVISERPDPQA